MKIQFEEFDIAMEVPKNGQLTMRDNVKADAVLPPLLFIYKTPNYSLSVTAAPKKDNMTAEDMLEFNLEVLMKMDKDVPVIKFIICKKEHVEYDVIMLLNQDYILQTYYFFEEKIFCFTANMKVKEELTQENYTDYISYKEVANIIKSIVKI